MLVAFNVLVAFNLSIPGWWRWLCRGCTADLGRSASKPRYLAWFVHSRFSRLVCVCSRFSRLYIFIFADHCATQASRAGTTPTTCTTWATGHAQQRRGCTARCAASPMRVSSGTRRSMATEATKANAPQAVRGAWLAPRALDTALEERRRRAARRRSWPGRGHAAQETEGQRRRRASVEVR